MRTKRTAWSTLITLCISCFALQAYGGEFYLYQGKIGERVKDFTWQLTNSEFVIISLKQDDFTFTNVCKHNGETVLWEVKGLDTSIQAFRKENLLIIKGTKFGEIVDSARKIDSSPWYQPLSYSLRKFSKSDKDQVFFWTIRFDNLGIRKLLARKKGFGETVVEKMPVKAHLVEVKLKWGLSMLWYATYWFRAEDGVFLRYESVHGFPGTDKTIIALKADDSAERFASNLDEP